MNEQEVLNSKTVLEYLVLVNDKSYSQIGRELNITPQQFHDWIKKRRPIPASRLNELSRYFEISQDYLVNESNYCKNLNLINKIDIQVLLLKKVIEKGNENTQLYEEKIQKLQKEKIKQIRLGRLAGILQQENEDVNQVIDKILELIELGKIEKLNQSIHKL